MDRFDVVDDVVIRDGPLFERGAFEAAWGDKNRRRLLRQLERKDHRVQLPHEKPGVALPLDEAVGDYRRWVKTGPPLRRISIRGEPPKQEMFRKAAEVRRADHRVARQQCLERRIGLDQVEQEAVIVLDTE